MTIAMFFSTAYVAHADDTFNPSVVKLFINGGIKLNDDVGLSAIFAPSSDLVNGFNPSLYLGPTWHATKWLDTTVYAGWIFNTEDPLVSLALSPYIGQFWAFVMWDSYLRSESGYLFIQAEYKLTDWLHIGAEGDGWGDYKSGAAWAYGGGPNLLLRFGKIGFDLALYSRRLEGDAALEFQMRAQLFL